MLFIKKFSLFLLTLLLTVSLSNNLCFAKSDNEDTSETKRPRRVVANNSEDVERNSVSVNRHRQHGIARRSGVAVGKGTAYVARGAAKGTAIGATKTAHATKVGAVATADASTYVAKKTAAGTVTGVKAVIGAFK
jgi:hypothetical protein